MILSDLTIDFLWLIGTDKKWIAIDVIIQIDNLAKT